MFFVSLLLALVACSGPAELKYDSADVVDEPSCAAVAGMQICDFPAIDSVGNEVSLSSLYGKPIVLDLSAMWCGPCKAAGANTQHTADALGDVTLLTVLIENEYGEPPTAEDLERWSQSYDIESEPVWGSSRDIITNSPIDRSRLFLEGWPTFYFIDSEGNLQDYLKGYSEDEIMYRASLLD